MKKEENGEQDERMHQGDVAYKLTQKADDDLDNIWDYTELTWGIEQAEKYVRSIEACFMDLALGKNKGTRARIFVRAASATMSASIS